MPVFYLKLLHYNIKTKPEKRTFATPASLYLKPLETESAERESIFQCSATVVGLSSYAAYELLRQKIDLQRKKSQSLLAFINEWRNIHPTPGFLIFRKQTKPRFSKWLHIKIDLWPGSSSRLDNRFNSNNKIFSKKTLL